MAKDAVATAQDTLVEHLKQPVPPELLVEVTPPPANQATVLSGHPDPMTTYPETVIVVDTPVAGRIERRAPKQVSQEDVYDTPTTYEEAAEIAVLWDLGIVTVPLQLQVAANADYVRDQIRRTVDVALASDILDGGARLMLDALDYHGQKVCYAKAGTWRNADTSSQVGTRRWYSEIEVEAELPLVMKTTLKKIRELELRWRFVLGAKAQDVSVEEIQTVFTDGFTPP